jgi:hypothetical protein
LRKRWLAPKRNPGNEQHGAELHAEFSWGTGSGQPMIRQPLYGAHNVGEAFDVRELPADPNRDSIIDELKAKGVATRGGGRLWK